MRISHRRNVRDQQSIYEIRLRHREDHSSFSAHGMSKDVHLPAKVTNDFSEITSEVGISVAGAMKTLSVVSHVYRDDVAVVRKPL